MGKQTAVDALGPTTSAYVNRGPACEAAMPPGSGVGCYLTIQQRGRLIELLRGRVTHACSSFRAACAALEVEALIAKDDDLPWFVTLLLDAASAYAGGLISAGLKALRARGLDYLQRVASGASIAPPAAEGWVHSSVVVLTSVSDKSIESSVKRVFDVAKRAGGAALTRPAAAAPPTAREAKISYLDLLMDQAGPGFLRISEELPASANDAELVLVFDAFRPEAHGASAYKASLRRKLERYHQSGVEQIGAHPMQRGDRHLHKSDPRRRVPARASPGPAAPVEPLDYADLPAAFRDVDVAKLHRR